MVIVGALATWRHEVLILELLEIGVFVTFWFFQTIQLWDVGLTPPGGDMRRVERRFPRHDLVNY